MFTKERGEFRSGWEFVTSNVDEHSGFVGRELIDENGAERGSVEIRRGSRIRWISFAENDMAVVRRRKFWIFENESDEVRASDRSNVRREELSTELRHASICDNGEGSFEVERARVARSSLDSSDLTVFIFEEIVDCRFNESDCFLTCRFLPQVLNESTVVETPSFLLPLCTVTPDHRFALFRVRDPDTLVSPKYLVSFTCRRIDSFQRVVDSNLL